MKESLADRRRFGFLCWCTAVGLALWLGACGGDSPPNGPGPAVALKLNIQLETPVLASQIRAVTLTLRYGTSMIPDLVDTLHFADGEVRDTISIVPADSILFILRALDGNGRVLYEGSEARHAPPGIRLELNILLRPVVLMLRVGPLFQTTTLSIENLVGVYVEVYNVDSLFGAAFRVRYDTTILRFAGAHTDAFLKGTADPGFPLLEFLKDTLDFVAYSVSRMRQPSGALPPGVSTDTVPGRLVSFSFAKVAAGSCDLTLDNTAALLDRYGKPIPGAQSLVLESATVEVVAGTGL
jgi:hypothetical protein